MQKVGSFSNHLPVHIIFGEGKIGELSTLMKENQLNKAFLIVDQGLEEKIPGISSVMSTINADKYEKKPGEPTIIDVEEITEKLSQSDADVVIAIGGGSVMDAAKAARLCVTQNKKLSELLTTELTYTNPALPLITIPTTAGTGSEVSGGAIITDPVTHEKIGLGNPLLRGQFAIVDPMLTYGLPKSATAYCGIDAVAQAIAAIIAKVRTPIGTAVALEAIRLASDALPKAVHTGDAVARSNMACASLMAGLAMNISDCTAEHSIGQALGGTYNLPHGLTVGLVLAETMERERKHVPELMERIADALGEQGDAGKGMRAVAGIQRLIAEIDLPVLKDTGFKEEHIEDLAEKTMNDFFITQAPVSWDKIEVVEVLQKCFEIKKR